jgi:Ni,Fe-hydrogenase III small subunit/ferredoxin
MFLHFWDMIESFKIWQHHGKQFIPDVTKVTLPEIFRGRPQISTATIDEQAAEALCPTGAILKNPMRIDMGKCTFCGECAWAFPEKFKFVNDYKTATNDRQKLIIAENDLNPILLNPELVREEIRKYFGNSLKLRQVSAAGDNSNEMELNACINVNFDMSRFGIDWVASPRHADGIVIAGPISENMAAPLQICYDAMPHPKIVILAGTDAISGGIFAGSPALNRSFLDNMKVDLYVPGNPIHPLTFINGVLTLMGKI